MPYRRPHTLESTLQRLLWLCVWAGLLLTWFATPAAAATYTVTNTNDSGAGSLRQAITQAMATPAADTIVFASSANGVITLQSQLPDLLSSGGALTITGNGPANTIIDGAGGNRAFHALHQTGLQFTLHQLTIRNGFAANGEGGAIFLLASNGSLTVENVEFVNNHSTWEGGAVRSTSAAVTVRNSLFQGNVSSQTHGSGISVHNAALDVRNSSFTGHGSESVLYAQEATTRLVNVTATNNQTSIGTLRVFAGTLSLSNCLLAGNNSADLYIAANPVINYAGSRNNLIGNKGNTSFTDGDNGNQVGVLNPLVGPLGNYGGTTHTLPLLPGSPAINAGTTTGGDIPSVDQRGIGRVGSPDIGAFESRGFTLSQVSGNSQSAVVGTQFASPLMVEVTAHQAIEPVVGGHVHFSAPTSGASAVPATPAASITSGGQAQTLVTANATAGGPYSVTASAAGTTPASVDFSLTNTPAGNPACAGFSFPYTLSGTDNTARVAELRQAIECANANATDDVIDLGGHTLVLTDAPYSNAHGDTALPFITSVLELQNGQLERDAGAPPFRFILADAASTLTVRDMQLRGGSASGEGGAILSLSASPMTVRASVFEDNNASTRGGAVSAQGHAFIVMSDFIGNAAPDGAALAAYQTTMNINNRFFANGDAASDSVLWIDGYGALVGNLFTDNHLSATGSSLMVFASNTTVAEMRHTTIADNTAQGPLLRMENGNNAQVRNSILWGNTSTGLGDLSPLHSIFPGAPAADGNLDVDPAFVATPGNYRLAAGSPAIDAGHNGHSMFDNFDIDDDGDSTELLPDLDLSPRPWDDPDVPDTGAGTAPIVDIGAYERQPPVTLPTLSINDVSVNEGDSGTTDAVFTISLSAPAPLGGTAFDIATTDGTATTADNDYVAQSLTAVLIPAGQSSTTFTVQVNGDTAVEPDETFFVNVTNIVNAVAGDAQGLGTIVNDDADPCAGFSFPYTLSGANNAARVANLRQAIHCANANATDDVIDMAGATLVFDAPDASTFDESALPNVTSVITLRNGTLQRDAAAADFRLLTIEGSGELVGESLDFRNGLASVGAAIYSEGDLTLHDVGFFDNGDLAATGQGGAIHHGGNTLRIIDSRFERNAATSGGAVSISTGDLWMRGSLLQGNQANEGGALYSESIAIRLFDNAFVANQARRGGAIKCFGGRISGTRFENNTADELAGAVYMEFAFVDLFISNGLFLGNQAPDGAVLVGNDAMTHLNNVTISGHSAGAGSLLASGGDEIVMANSIVWGNGGASLGTATVRHSLIEGGYPGGSNIIDLDPRFIDAANDDFRLASGSPAIDAGNNANIRRDSWMDLDDDGVFDNELDDMDGNPRRYDDAGMADSGAGTAPIVDMGAYERQTNSGAPGITVNPTSGLVTTEAGGSATFTVVLDTQPNADVSIALSSSDTTEGTVAPASLTFTLANWNVAQTVTVTGVDDTIADGDVAYTIVTAAAASADANYDGLDPADVSVTNTDDDIAGITVSPTSGLVTTEGMGPTGTPGVDQFSVVLNSQPTGDVTIGLSSSDTTEGNVSPASLTFTPANWNTAQHVNVLSVDDSVVDGDIAYTIITAPAVSADPAYDGLNPADVSVTNMDNDVAGITVTPTSGLVTTEAGGSDTFTVVLANQPSADVTIALSSSDTTEGTVSPVSLTFTAGNWNTGQTVTVTGVDDTDVDGDIAYTIITAPAVSADANYNGFDPADVSVTNIDNDVHTAQLVALKSVVQVGTDSQPVIYEIVLENIGDGDQPDDPASHELIDALPAQLTLVDASANAGSISTDPASNSVFWNGALTSGASVTILIQADVAISHAATISNQASIHFDSDGDGLNDAAALSSDPAQPGTDVPTRFQFAGTAAPNAPVLIPATGRAALLWMMASMLIGAGLALRLPRS